MAIVRDLLTKYPDLLEKARLWDCSFEEVIERKKREARGETLTRWL